MLASSNAMSTRIKLDVIENIELLFGHTDMTQT